MSPREGVRRLAVLLIAGALLFTARFHDLSLPSLEDAFYAREAVEMARAGRVFTVTWDGEPTHQHPPLQLWLVGRAFAALGESDLAARLPTVVMALGTLAVTFRIGVLTVGTAAAGPAVAFLLATPFFVEHARRVMMEVPLTLWVAATLWLYLEGLRRPAWHVALALPLGAAILTKSVLGLMPLLALAGSLASPTLRAPLRRSWIWLGLLLGLLLGAAWPLHQLLTQGVGAVESHFLAHVMRRSARRFDAAKALVTYPWLLLKFYQPVIIPGFLGAWLLVRRPGPLRARGAILAAWILVPVALYGLTSFRTPRFVFPVVVPLAVCAGYWLSTTLPRLADLFVRWLAPLGAVAIAAALWIAAPYLVRDPNAVFKREATALRRLIPEGEPLAYLGNHYWLAANPLLYYGERRLAPSSPSAREAVEAAGRRRSRLLLCARARVAEIVELGVPTETVLEGQGWTLFRVPGAGGG